MYLLVKDGEQIKRAGFPEGEPTKKRIARMLEKYDDDWEVIEYKEPLPDYPIECLFWTTEGEGGIVVRSELMPIDWYRLEEMLSELPTRLKMLAGHNYLQMLRACIEKDLAFLGQAFLVLEKMDPEDQQLYWLAFETSKVPSDIYLEGPF